MKNMELIVRFINNTAYLCSEQDLRIGDLVLCFEDKECKDFVGIGYIEELYLDNSAYCFGRREPNKDVNYAYFVQRIVYTADQLLRDADKVLKVNDGDLINV
jgi:hypothetical protein